ncbi:SDR family oxidoreductase [Ferruginibacter sp. SUN002]|uniref:SDR family oxidoreductase n=1 Tax=Ferruginibacter sp. SUN002 TaxID=2937789 RepID=UPI003D36A491
MKKKIFIAGGGGMLGEGFYQVFKDEYDLLITDIDTNEPWISYLDFRDANEYKKQVKEYKADFLFHLGAHTSLEYCDKNPDDAYETNTLAVENAVHISNELNIPLLYISTAGIFDGKQETYDDWDLPNPLGHYARSKYMGELYVKENKGKHIICRAGWMMGAGPKKDKKFVQKLMAQLKEGKKELFVVNDKLGTPTYTHDFARNVKLLLENEYWGLYNLVCGGETGRFEVAEELLKLLGKENEIKLTAVDSDYFKKEFFSHRPASERLINAKLILRKCNIIRDWKTCLKEYIDNYYQGYLD